MIRGDASRPVGGRCAPPRGHLKHARVRDRTAADLIDKHELAKSYKRLVRLLLERGNAVVVYGLDVITEPAVVRLPPGRGHA